MTIAYSYARFSAKKQEHNESLHRQAKATLDICKENGWSLDEKFTVHDLGVSAFRDKKVEAGPLTPFLEAVSMGRVSAGSVLIVDDIDRLGRGNAAKMLLEVVSILKAGVSVFVRQPKWFFTPDKIDEQKILEAIVLSQT